MRTHSRSNDFLLTENQSTAGFICRRGASAHPVGALEAGQWGPLGWSVATDGSRGGIGRGWLGDVRMNGGGAANPADGDT